MDAREQLNLVTDECHAFLAKPDFRERPTEYFALLGKLKTLVNSHTIPNDVRLDAYLIRSTMKGAFNSVNGKGLTATQKQFKLYGHPSLTSKCRVKPNVGTIGHMTSRCEYVIPNRNISLLFSPIHRMSKLVMAMRLALK